MPGRRRECDGREVSPLGQATDIETKGLDVALADERASLLGSTSVPQHLYITLKFANRLIDFAGFPTCLVFV